MLIIQGRHPYFASPEHSNHWKARNNANLARRAITVMGKAPLWEWNALRVSTARRARWRSNNTPARSEPTQMLLAFQTPRCAQRAPRGSTALRVDSRNQQETAMRCVVLFRTDPSCHSENASIDRITVVDLQANSRNALGLP